jgi:hypothetical protein
MDRKTFFFLILTTCILVVSSVMMSVTVIIINDPAHKDTDNDNVTDDKDIFPEDPSEQMDTDNDGIGDNADKFPSDPAASIDSDNDGYPDRWNPGKTQNDSTSIPPLIIDAFPFNPDEWSDADGDGTGDNSDEFPSDPTECRDSDGDGVGDNHDKNPFVDLGFTFTLKQFKVTTRVDLLKWAQVYFEVSLDDTPSERITNQGKRWNVRLGNIQVIDYILTYDVPDDTARDVTTLEVAMYDHDLLFNDDVIDINPDSSSNTLVITYDHATNTVSSNGTSHGSQGSIWYSFTLPHEIEPNSDSITKAYYWRYAGQRWDFTLDIPRKIFESYQTSDVDRSPQNSPLRRENMAAFVTPQEKIIQDTAHALTQLASQMDFNQTIMVDFALRFVQSNVQYQADNETKGCVEYWRYPVETLVEKKGDCEDSAVLFASIMDALGYKAALLFYILDDDVGHLAVGIHVDTNESLGHSFIYQGTTYYYCETTTIGYTIGDLPPDINREPTEIIPV